MKLVADLLKEADEFFANVEAACEELQQARQEAQLRRRRTRGAPARVDRTAHPPPELVQDNVTLPIQRLREAVSELIKLSEDKEIGQELMECNRRLAELREEVAVFLEPERGGPCLLGRAHAARRKEPGAQRRAD